MRKKFPEPIAGDEFIKDAHNETAEEAYRRGYRDGTLVAIDEFAGRFMMKSEHDALWRFVEAGALSQWDLKTTRQTPVMAEFPPDFYWPGEYGDRPVISGFKGLKTKEFPQFKCFTTSNGGADFWCPFCKVWHNHSIDPPGHRVAHCGTSDSSTGPLMRWGYIVKSYTKAELQKIYLMVKATLKK